MKFYEIIQIKRFPAEPSQFCTSESIHILKEPYIAGMVLHLHLHFLLVTNPEFPFRRLFVGPFSLRLFCRFMSP
jgi:hypothetical protein